MKRTPEIDGFLTTVLLNEGPEMQDACQRVIDEQAEGVLFRSFQVRTQARRALSEPDSHAAAALNASPFNCSQD